MKDTTSLLIIAALLAVPAGCGLTKKITNNRDEGQLQINRQISAYAVNKDGTLLILEVRSGSELSRDEGGDGRHSELNLDPTKLKPK